MATIIELKNITKKFAGVTALNDVSLSVEKGEIVGLIGDNGAGKSTLANVVMGHPAYEITEGHIFYQGQPLEELEVFERARVVRRNAPSEADWRREWLMDVGAKARGGVGE